MGDKIQFRKNITTISLWVVILILLYISSMYNYLLFHSIAEIFSIVVACAIFMIALNSRKFMDNNYLVLLGIAYLFVGGLDLLHMLGYKGMGIFEGYDANLPTQLWIGARYVESISLLLTPFFLNRDIKIKFITLIYLSVFIILVLMIFGRSFPDCYIEGIGLTPFKKLSEYIISIILISAIILLIRKREQFDENVFLYIIVSILLSVFSELAFTFYLSVYGISNLIGHYFKIISFFLIYKAIIETGLKKPYGLLFRNLKKNEDALREEGDKLKEALEQVKLLSGLLPICSHCKKIRDENGNWKQIESYIHEHSEAKFSHAICPECARKHYPDVKIYD